MDIWVGHTLEVHDYYGKREEGRKRERKREKREGGRKRNACNFPE